MTPILIAALLLVPVVQDQTDAFCDPLKQIVAAAPDDYRAIAGEPHESGSLSVRVKPEIEGDWTICGVFQRVSGSMAPASYTCALFSERAPTDAQVAALASRAAGCFGAEVHVDDFPAPKGFGYPAERKIRLAPFEILVMALRNDNVSGRGWHRVPHYLAVKPVHSYELMLQVRPIQN